MDLGDRGRTIAVRVPDHDFTRELLRSTGPLAVSSANVSGQPAATTVADGEAAARQAGARLPRRRPGPRRRPVHDRRPDRGARGSCARGGSAARSSQPSSRPSARAEHARIPAGVAGRRGGHLPAQRAGPAPGLPVQRRGDGPRPRRAHQAGPLLRWRLDVVRPGRSAAGGRPTALAGRVPAGDPRRHGGAAGRWADLRGRGDRRHGRAERAGQDRRSADGGRGRRAERGEGLLDPAARTRSSPSTRAARSWSPSC